MLLGLYLIKDGSYVHEFVLREEDATDSMDSKGFFEMAIRLYGAYLIVRSISSCLEIIVNLVVILSAAPYVDLELEPIRSKAVPVSSTIALGMYCLLRGKSFIRLAFH